MKKTNKNIKNKIKILFIVVLMLASALVISAGDIIFKAGSLDISQDLVVSNKLGIGTSSPSEKLEIKDGALYVHGASNGMGRIVMGLDGYTQFEWYPKTNGLQLYDRISDATRFMVLNNGNIGIGTTNPQTTLHLERSSGAVGIRLKNDWQAWDIVTGNGNLFFKRNEGATTEMTLVEGGKLGIGTTSPSVNLHIKGSVPSLRLEDTGWQDWDLVATHGGSSGRLDIKRSGGAVTVMSIVEVSGGGNVGIGTTSPKTTLHLQQPSGTTGIRLQNDWQAWDIVTYNGNLFFKRNEGVTTEMTLVEGGKLGIGTTSPGTTLHLKRASGATGIRMENDWQAWDIVTDRGNLYFKRNAGETTEMVLVEGGKLGIGTTSPTERIHVVGAIKASEFKTGDITFNKDDKPVWRMFEDEDGLYVESLTTGKVYSVMLKEISAK